MRNSILILLLLTGCSTFSNQGLKETVTTITYSEPDENGDQYIVEETKNRFRLKDFVAAAPWRGAAGTEHAITYIQTGEGVWSISFGGANRLDGGDISELVSELKDLAEILKPPVIP